MLSLTPKVVIERVSIKKETAERLHQYCFRGEKHENLVNRLIDVCKEENQLVNLSDAAVERLLSFTGCRDIDEALNLLMDSCRHLKKGCLDGKDE